MAFFKFKEARRSFKKIFRRKQGRYLGYYLDRQAQEISQVQNDGWYGIEWGVFWQARSETLHPSLYSNIQIKPHLYNQFLDTGSFNRQL